MVVETSTAVALPNAENVAEMEKLMSDGKRNYVCQQPHLAMDCFVELCEMMSKCYGQESEKCVDAYLMYGKTLIDVARLENGVLGHAIKEMPVFGSETDDAETEKEETNTEDEEDSAPNLKPEEIREKVVLALRNENLYNEQESEDEGTEDEGEEEGEVAGGDNETDAANKANNGDAKSETLSEQVTSSSTSGKKSETMEVDDGIESDGSDHDNDNDDVSNLELAWEMLELTSIILKRQLEGGEKLSDADTVKTKLAEAKYGLAQISMEAGRYNESVLDFTECLELFKEVHEDKNGRIIAEGYYNIALALSLDKKYAEAIQGYEKAVSILKARVEDLEAKVKVMGERKDASDADEKLKKEYREEIAELNDLIVLDMMAKIEDAQEAKKGETRNNAPAVAQTGGSSTSEGFDAGFSDGSSNEVAHDCTSNVRSVKASVKRKSDDEMSDGNEKKVKET